MLEWSETRLSDVPTDLRLLGRDKVYTLRVANYLTYKVCYRDSARRWVWFLAERGDSRYYDTAGEGYLTARAAQRGVIMAIPEWLRKPQYHGV